MLESLVEELRDSPLSARESVVELYASAAFERDLDAPLSPGFCRALLWPVLLEGVHRRQARYIWWTLAASRMGLRRLLPDASSAPLDEELLELAVELDPSDIKAPRRLGALLADHLEYATHELPDCWVGSVELAERTLARLHDLIARYPVVAEEPILEVARETDDWLSSWRRYVASAPELPFAQWLNAAH